MPTCLLHRLFVRRIDTCSAMVCGTNGVKQGDIISLMLYKLYMDDLSLTKTVLIIADTEGVILFII